MNGIIRTGLCSYGMSGKLFHAPFIEAHPGYNFAAVVERNKDEARIRYPQVKRYLSVDEMLRDETLELIIVNTPTFLHYEHAKAAIRSGKHVILEKPMVTTVEEAEDLIRLAEEQRVFFTIYQNKRYDGDFRAVRSIVKEGLLGDLREVEMKYDRYRLSLSGKKHKEGDLPGSGVLYDLGAHLIDQSLQLFGQPQSLYANIWTMRENTEADDYFELLLYYHRLVVRLKASCLVREPLPAYVLHGTKGSFLQQRSDQQEKRLLEAAIPSLTPWTEPPSIPDGLLHTEMNGKPVREEKYASPGNYMDYFDEVYRAIADGKPNPVPARDGLAIMRILEAANKSSESGSTYDLQAI